MFEHLFLVHIQEFYRLEEVIAQVVVELSFYLGQLSLTLIWKRIPKVCLNNLASVANATICNEKNKIRQYVKYPKRQP
jgi:hypothetical protein